MVFVAGNKTRVIATATETFDDSPGDPVSLLALMNSYTLLQKYVLIYLSSAPTEEVCYLV